MNTSIIGGVAFRDKSSNRNNLRLDAAEARHEAKEHGSAPLSDQHGGCAPSFLSDVDHAVMRGELQLHYQPKLNVRTGSVTSVEALVRWIHPQHGLMPTDKFIEAAEATGAIGDVTRWVVDRALSDGDTLRDAGHDLRIFVNVSGQLLPTSDFARTILERTRGRRGGFGLEITETAVIQDPEAAIANLNAFAASGLAIAIDDYGAGLSSLTYLKQLPAHELKIDRSFVSALTHSHRDPLLVRSTIDLAHALEMEVTAEGVDDPLTLSLLRAMGCDLIQGFLVSPAIPIDALIDFLDNARGNPDLFTQAAAQPLWARSP